MPKSMLLIVILLVCIYVVFMTIGAIRTAKIDEQNKKRNRYEVRLHQIGYDGCYEYILHGIEGEDEKSVAENAKMHIAQCGYFGVLSAQHKYDEIAKLLVIDSIELER